MRLAATKPSCFLAKHQQQQHQPIPTRWARVAAAAAEPCSCTQAKKSRGNRAWRIAVASSDAEAEGEDDPEAGQLASTRTRRAGRRARLSARRRESVRLPDGVSGDGIGAFLRHPAGVESLLNTGALQSFAPAGSGAAAGTFTCTLRRIGLLGFEVSPVLDLRVNPTGTDCTVEMLSCRFEGSESIEQQNELFSAFMRNHITWGDNGEGPCLDFDVNLEVTLEADARLTGQACSNAGGADAERLPFLGSTGA
ncbi:uncharacterized protein LOC133896206 isoform X2 [Phragmites australis]|uniref:uncharacterized protein LOC133896206 isoform X2 n=1 Tax=Phragmites australis TaxID=29695 RepID=UPI002D77CA98|nr:uncharacterized protein LOC133896206 isoform X2 [Phragmites australis]